MAEKPVLAYILRSALDEYAGYTPQEIAERFIEGEPEVRTIAVHQDHPDRPRDAEREAEEAGTEREAKHGSTGIAHDTASGMAESSSHGIGNASFGMMSGDDKITGLPTVDKSQRDGTIFYDIYFRAILPLSGGLADIYVNIEIQNNDTPGYPITKRGIYYASRMIYPSGGMTSKIKDTAR